MEIIKKQKVSFFQFSVVNLDRLFHVVVSRALRVLVDVLQPDVGLGVRLLAVGVLGVLSGQEVPKSEALDVLLVQVPRAAVEDEREAILLELLVGNILESKTNKNI